MFQFLSGLLGEGARESFSLFSNSGADVSKYIGSWVIRVPI